jgi:cyclopropane fatty-acyl-phospholipid synthase-like methyltransferase
MIDIARKHVGSAGLDNRISFASASAEASTWPAGVDAILMSYLFSAVGQTEVTQLIAKAFDALRPGGQFLVHDFVVDDDRSGPDLAALVMVMGNPDAAFLTPGRLDTMLDRAGFVEIETKPLISDLTSLTQARKPSPA